MATLTTYTQALNPIATQTFDPSHLVEFTYSADASLTMRLTGSLAPGITDGDVYGIAVHGLAEPIYATFLGMWTTPAGDDGYMLKFKRMSPDAEKIVKAVLAELDTHETKPAEPEPFDYDAYRQKLDATIAGMKRLGAVTVTWA